MTGSFVPHGDQASDVDRYDKLPSAPDLATANKGLRNFPAQWHSAELMGAWAAVTRVALKLPRGDDCGLREIADAIEAADIDLEPRP